MPKKQITAVDLFCGAGGSSSGLRQMCNEHDLGLHLTGINHWDVAIDTHQTNHPDSDHYCADLDTLDPYKLFPNGRINLLMASPACTHHSRARGDKPMSDQSRSSAWAVLRWAEALYVDNLLIENVREFIDWGPLGADGRPLASKKGQTFQAFITALRSLGYNVEWKLLNAANYGDPTTRERLFILARRGNRKITWPEATHSAKGEATLFGTTKKWRSAAEIIDWEFPSQSIFERSKPLAENTLRRIAEGLKRYCGLPFLTPNFTERTSQSPRTHAIGAPIPTVTGHGAGCLVQPFLVKYYGGAHSEPITRPLPTVTANYEHYGLAEPFIVELRKNATARGIGDPVSTITTSGAHHALAEPFLVKFNGTGTAYALSQPIDTVTTKDRFGLVQPIPLGDGLALDIRFRMLQPHELAAAQGFPAEYKFKGNRAERVKQIGNAVPVGTAKALCAQLLLSV